MEDTLEQRILKSNLSDDDKIEIIKLIERSYNYPVYVPTIIPQPTITYCHTTATSGPYLSNSSLRS